MFDNLFYIYAFILGIILGVVVTGLTMIFTRPLLVTQVVYDRAEECVSQGGEYSMFHDGDWEHESCSVVKNLYE